jgi:thiosulfate dehydrogenase [quinone] large subunit
MNGITQRLKDRRVTGIFWLGVRLLLAYEWLTAGLEKVQSAAWVGDKVPAGIHGFLAGAVTKTAGAHPTVFGWYGDFLNSFAIPNERVFTYMVAYGEVLIGAALLLGLFTKWAAFWGAFMNLNFILAGSTSANGYMMALEVGLVFAGLGVSFYGLDTFVLPALRKLLTTKVLHQAPAPKPSFTQAPHPVG